MKNHDSCQYDMHDRTPNTDAASPRLFDCHRIEVVVGNETRESQDELLAQLIPVETEPTPQNASTRCYRHEDLKAMPISQHPLLLQSISGILYECDPMCLQWGHNEDEYDPEAVSIIYALHDAKSADDVANVVVREFQHWFSYDLSPYKDNPKFVRMCWRIWTAWFTHHKPDIL